jgi:CHASE domain
VGIKYFWIRTGSHRGEGSFPQLKNLYPPTVGSISKIVPKVIVITQGGKSLPIILSTQNKTKQLSPTRHNITNNETMKFEEKHSVDMTDDGADTTSLTGKDVDGAPLTVKASRDDRIARGGRITVMAVLLVSAATIAALTYFLLSKSEYSSFESQVRTSSCGTGHRMVVTIGLGPSKQAQETNPVLYVLCPIQQFESTFSQVTLMANRNAVNTFISFRTLASVYASKVGKSGQASPFVTIKGFEKMVAGFRNVSKVSSIHYCPLLKSAAELQQWNTYSISHANWIAESRRNQKPPGGSNASYDFVPFVFQPDANRTLFPATGNGPFCPIWQISPVRDMLTLLNFDTISSPPSRLSMEYAGSTGNPSLAEPMPVLREFFEIAVDGPVSLLQEPVYNETDDKSPRELIGFLTGALGWQIFFENVLPSGQENILVVIESCSINSTFVINGPKAVFVKDGDHHDPRYESMARTEYFVGSKEDIDPTKARCKHRIHVFPTKELEDEYLTKSPALYAMFIVLIFVFAGFVFVAYDTFVTNRQYRTEKEASQSNAIVQELFPGDVAARLFSSQEGGVNITPSKKGFTTVDQTTIAELHPDATVLCTFQVSPKKCSRQCSFAQPFSQHSCRSCRYFWIHGVELYSRSPPGLHATRINLSVI